MVSSAAIRPPSNAIVRYVRLGLSHSIGFLLIVSTVGCEAFNREQYERYRNGQDSGVVETDITAIDVVDPDVPGLGGGGCLVRNIPDDAGCARAVFPAVPANVMPTPSNGRTYVFAVKEILFGAGNFGNWNQYGFDLDGVCTDPSVIPPRISCANRQLVGDGQQGRDNAFGVGIGTALYISDYFQDPVVNMSIQTARITPGLKITEWSGLDDRTVTVEMVMLVQGRPPAGSASLTWDGRDTWDVERSYTYSRGGNALTSTNAAATACGWLIARFPMMYQLFMPYRAAMRRFTMRNVHLAGPLSEQGGTVDIAATGTVTDLTNDLEWMGLCANDPNAAVTREDVRVGASRSLDVLQDLSFNPAQPCNATSIAGRMTLVPVQLGSTVDTPLANYDPCPADAGTPNG